MALHVDTFFLDPNSQGTLQSQIQQMIAEGILSGRFRKGEKLPSSRNLSKHFGVSRITVTLAYTELQANDYLEARDRSGYFVSKNAPEPPAFPQRAPREDNVDWDRVFQRKFSEKVTPTKPKNWAEFKYPFIYGQTDATLFDHTNWRLCALQALGLKDFASMTQDYYDQDDPKLVEFVARHSLPRRGISARPEEIIITLGAQNALWLTAKLLLDANKRAVIENPSYHSQRDILKLRRCHITPVNVDKDGLPPSMIPDDTDVVFTTPSHQCPTTAFMPMKRRQELLQRAKDIGALIVEDDYEFEMSFLTAPSPSLKSLDHDGRVIYVGSFSKSLFPGLRLGYLVGSEPFIREVRALRATVLRHPPGQIQRTAAYFLGLGHYDTLIRRMLLAMHERAQVMETAIAEHGLNVAGRGAFGGSSLWMEAPEDIDTTRLAQKLEGDSVLIEPGAPFFANEDAPKNFYRLAYSSIPTERIPEGIAKIARALE
ncbi:MAG: PLP-dependent aminotransferase family protein [Paracoccaceae bacterium]|nr:PLP-dependent aminotransferase family protein [Paracoccaceae bacterium]MDG1739554.1 PLP-dependent aminotransferase family protein [Paracoccaceae bacterium]MDG2258194.1 PLP-dependent aminotransferase family protein [Paracoccaceae bacterium]